METVLLKVHSDIAETLDKGYMAALIIFDLCVASDVINHLIILKPLEFSFGMKEKALTLGKVLPHIQNSLCFSHS